MNNANRPPRRVNCIEPLEQRMLLYAATVGVNTGTTHQVMDGFGAAMITWARQSEYDNNPAFYDRIVNDLGATIARTAIWPTFEKSNDNADPNSFNWAGYDSAALGKAMTFLKRLQDRGMSKFLASVWTAPPWLKTNQSFFYGGTVRPDLREEYAEYLAAVAIAAQRDFGVNLSHISPQNEPFFVQEYESSTYTAEQMREVVRAVMRKFSDEGLGTKLVIPEEMAKGGRYDWYADALAEDPETANFPGVFGVHGATNPHWPEVGEAVSGKGHRLWHTESHGHDQTIQGALLMAQDIWNALSIANASSYIYWQWSEDASDGKHSLMVNGQPAIKYHVAKHFYRYIRPDAVRIGATSSDSRLRTLSFRHPQTGAVTHVLFNRDVNSATVTMNLSGSGLPSTYKQYRTSATENHVQLANVNGTNQVSVTLPANSIVTLYSGADLAPVSATSGGTLPSHQSLNDHTKATRLSDAAARGDVGDIREFLSQGDNINASSFGGFTALHAAAISPYAGAVDVINELIARGANVNAVTSEGFTPLHLAAMNVWTRGETMATTLAGDKIRALKTGGASVTAKDAKGRTPLHWGAMMIKLSNDTNPTQDRNAVDALLDIGSAVNATDNAGFTPLDYAQREDNVAGANELKARGGVNGAGAPGDTTAPTSDVVNVSPDPRATPVASIDVTFSEPVTGVSLSDFALTRDGGALSLASATLAQVNPTTWRIGNLSSLTDTPGSYMLRLEKNGSGITDGAGNPLATSASDSWTFPAVGSTTQAPFKGSPFAFGASAGVTIQAEDFDLGGEGVAYHETTAANLGGLYRPGESVDIKSQAANLYRVSDAIAGEWLEYSIDAQQSGTYELEFRFSHSDPNARFHAEIDGAPVTGSLAVPDTNNYNVFASVKQTVAIPAGQHVLRLAFDANAANGSAGSVDWIRINPLAAPAGTTIVATNVSYVRDGTFANTNFGVADEMLVKRSSNAGNSREGYVMFDLNGVSSIGTAKLRLNGRLSDSTAPAGVAVNVHYAADDSWTEGGLTWNNKPAAGSIVRGSLVVTGTTNQWYEVDLTSFLQGELAAGRRLVTLVFKAPNTSNPWVIFGSDSTPNGPRLVITP